MYDLFVSWVSFFAEHGSVEACVAILTLCVYISPVLDQLTDSFDILTDNGDVKRRATQVVMEIELWVKVSSGHLSDILYIIITRGL